jgi:hypothetical protein
MSACEKTDPAPDDLIQGGSSANADTIANHLLFSNATKITGIIPKGPAGSSLKISIEDTLSLVDKFRVPVKFLHEDTTKNVAGVYAQIHVGSSGSTFYYDVPEVSDIATNDTVSVVLIGIDRDGLFDDSGVPPAGSPDTDITFEITFVPYDETGLLLGEITVPADISTPDTDVSGECGLINGIGEYWVWGISYITDPNDPTKDIFFNSRDKLWGLMGQLIQGCCTNGVSAYTANCLEQNKRKLKFYTFFNWPTELYQFHDNGAYSGLSEFLSADPDPTSSDFCGFRNGVVHEDFDRSFLEGTWKVNASVLQTLGTSTPQGGSRAARPDGKIIQLDCDYLITEQADREGGNQTLVKLYVRWDSDRLNWFPMD